MKRTLLAIMLGLGLGSGAWADEPDAQAGKALLEKHCFGCHGTEVYTREDRRVQLALVAAQAAAEAAPLAGVARIEPQQDADLRLGDENRRSSCGRA